MENGMKNGWMQGDKLGGWSSLCVCRGQAPCTAGSYDTGRSSQRPGSSGHVQEFQNQFRLHLKFKELSNRTKMGQTVAQRNVGTIWTSKISYVLMLTLINFEHLRHLSSAALGSCSERKRRAELRDICVYQCSPILNISKSLKVRQHRCCQALVRVVMSLALAAWIWWAVRMDQWPFQRQGRRSSSLAEPGWSMLSFVSSCNVT